MSKFHLSKGRRQNTPATALTNRSLPGLTLSERPWPLDNVVAFQGPLTTEI